MTGGDWLFIFTFIILPALVVAGCVWALILLFRGDLLPTRPEDLRKLRTPNQMTPVAESTGVFEPVAPPPPAVEQAIHPQPVVVASQAEPQADEPDELDGFDETRDFEIVPKADFDAAQDSEPDAVAANAEPLELGEQPEVIDSVTAQDAIESETPVDEVALEPGPEDADEQRIDDFITEEPTQSTEEYEVIVSPSGDDADVDVPDDSPATQVRKRFSRAGALRRADHQPRTRMRVGQRRITKPKD